MAVKGNSKMQPKRCVTCGTTDYLESGHLIDRAAGGSNTPDNRVPMCALCNRIKPGHQTRREALAWIVRIRKMTPTELLDEVRRMISPRAGQKEGFDRVIQRGAYLSNVAPYGYEKDPMTRGLQPNPWEAGIVRWVYTRISRASLNEIADQLNERNVPAPHDGGRWYHTMIRRILTHPRYAGKATHGDRLMTCPALVSESDQTVARVALKEGRKRSGPKGPWKHKRLPNGHSPSTPHPSPKNTDVTRTPLGRRDL
jgi:hypothetical protein